MQFHAQELAVCTWEGMACVRAAGDKGCVCVCVRLAETQSLVSTI